MKKLLSLALALVVTPSLVLASQLGTDGFIKVESIKGDSQYRNAKSFDKVQGIRGSWTNQDLPELRRLSGGMSKGQVRDALDSESVNYSSGWRGKQWQHAYNFQTGDQLGTHNICIVKIDFNDGVAQSLSFKNVNLNKIGSTVEVCEPTMPVGKSTETIIIREVQPLGDVKIKG
jgi:hypothetical protein